MISDFRILQVMLAGLFIAGTGVGCEPAPEGSPPGAHGNPAANETNSDAEASGRSAEEPTTTYSPFGVRVEGYPGFDVISFKSVGLTERLKGSDALIFEGLAQSLERDLEGHAELDVSAEVFHDETLADPSNHRSCEQRHIYVDLWHSNDPERLGYSLWAGCGEGDRFAWREVAAIEGDRDIVDELKPLSVDIADRLASEQQGGCFQKTC